MMYSTANDYNVYITRQNTDTTNVNKSILGITKNNIYVHCTMLEKRDEFLRFPDYSLIVVLILQFLLLVCLRKNCNHNLGLLLMCNKLIQVSCQVRCHALVTETTTRRRKSVYSHIFQT